MPVDLNRLRTAGADIRNGAAFARDAALAETVSPCAATSSMRLSCRLFDIADAIPDLIAEVRELRAIVDKLPVTADGVAVAPGMEVWLPGGYKYPGYVEYVMGDDLIAVNDMGDWPTKGCDTVREWTVRHPTLLYSTRERAEIAHHLANGPHDHDHLEDK